jgi:hypothetical protein
MMYLFYIAVFMSGDMKSTWSIDNFYIGKMPISPTSMSDNFEFENLADSWLFNNDGKIGSYCQHNTR